MPAPAFEALYIGSTMLVRVRNIGLESTGAEITDATVTMEKLTDADGVTIAGTENISLAYNAAAAWPGTYEAELPPPAGLVEGDTYYIHALASAGLTPTLKRFKRPCKARYFND